MTVRECIKQMRKYGTDRIYLWNSTEIRIWNCIARLNTRIVRLRLSMASGLCGEFSVRLNRQSTHHTWTLCKNSVCTSLKSETETSSDPMNTSLMKEK